MSNYDPYYDWDDVYEWEKAVYQPIVKTVKFIHPITDPENVEKYLNQTKVWTDKHGVDHKIKDLEKDYLANILMWLEENYTRVQFARSLIKMIELDADYFHQEVELHETPLVKKIRARYKKLVTA